uniref:hypothetical protein n=1 Tax=Shewanella sp. Shew256 TaxID=1969376 RepID=UPI003F923A91
EFRDKCVELMGDVPRLEMFARTKTKGWDVFGNEVKGSIDIPLRPEQKTIETRSDATAQGMRNALNKYMDEAAFNVLVKGQPIIEHQVNDQLDIEDQIAREDAA